jgi:mono/diheme cytochrome c family protein
MVFVEGEKTIYTWLKEHFDDPRNIVTASEMVAELTDEEAEFITNYALSLRSDEVPKKYRRIRGNISDFSGTKSGETLYREYCIACHATGKDSVYDDVFKKTIPAIMNPFFLKTIDDKFLKTIIAEGRADTQMTAWKPDAAGLTDNEMDKIIEYLVRERPAEKAKPFEFDWLTGDKEYGENLYRIRCMSCHGENGEGGVGLNLRNPVVQKLADPEWLAITVRDGRQGTHMAPFGMDGVGLEDRDILDVVTYIRSLSDEIN